MRIYAVVCTIIKEEMEAEEKKSKSMLKYQVIPASCRGWDDSR